MNKKTTLLSVMSFAILGLLFLQGGSRQVEKNDLTEENIEALSSYESNVKEEERIKCESNDGVYGHYSSCEASGFENVVCTVEGELDFMGVKIKGAYKKGSSHSIAWARYNCMPNEVTHTGCCTKSGLYSGEKKLA